MADVKFKKSVDKYYISFNNDDLVSARVTLTISWDLDDEGYSVPFECLLVTGKGGTSKRMCRSGDSGEKTLTFLINRDVKTDYELEFDGQINADISDDKRKLKIYHPLKRKLDAEKEIALANQDGWGVVIPGSNAIIDDSQVELYMERVDDPDNAGTALDAIEIPSFNGDNRMSFNNQTKDSDNEFFSIRSSYKTFYKFDLEGTKKEPKLNSGSGDWRDGETFPDGYRLEFFDGDGNDVNAYLHIKKKEVTVNTTNLEGARITFDVTEKVFKEDPNVPLTISGISNKQLAQFTDYVSEKPSVGNNVGNVTFSLVSADTATGFTVNTDDGVVRFTTPAYDDSGTSGANDYNFKLKATDSKTPIAQTGTITRTVSVLEPDPPPDPNVPSVILSVDPLRIPINGSSVVTFDFREEVFGFKKGDVVVSGGSIGSISGDGEVRTATVTPNLDYVGQVNIRVPANSFKNSEDVFNTTPKTIVVYVDEPVPEPPPAGDDPPPGGGTCGVNPPVITFFNGKWGIKIPDRVLEGSTMNIKGAKRDNPEEYGTALKNFGIEGSDGSKYKRELNPSKEIDEENITFKVQSSVKTFYQFEYLDNIKDPAYSKNNKRLEFRDEDGGDPNAWIEIDDKLTQFNCDDVPGVPETDCDPDPWMIGDDVYYPDSIPEPVPPELVESGGGLRLSLSSDRKDVKINLRNYKNQLVTLKLTWTTNASWPQKAILKNKYMSDLLIDGKTAAAGGSRWGDDGNEYDIPDLELIKGDDDVTKTLYLYNVDGGDYDTIVSMSSTPSSEPERVVYESVGTPVEGIVVGISARDEQGDLGDAYTSWGGSEDQEFKNQDGGQSPPNWDLGTEEKTTFTTFDMTGGSGSGLQISAKIYGREGTGGNLHNTTVQIQSIVNGGTGYSNGDLVTFPSPYNIADVIKITATAGRTDFSCVAKDEKETWTEAGGTWPRFPQEAVIAVNGGEAVEWYWEDGGGGPEWNDQKFTLEVVGKRSCVPWEENKKVSMDKQLQEYVWIPSTIIETNPDGEEGHSLEDYHIHSDKIRFRRPSTHSSLINLPVGGTGMKEFRGVAGALQPQYYGL